MICLCNIASVAPLPKRAHACVDVPVRAGPGINDVAVSECLLQIPSRQEQQQKAYF